MNGWYARRRGLLEHLESGLISLLDLAVHDWLCLKADYKTGVCIGSARMLYDLAQRREVSYRTIARSFAHLEAIGWIKRFRVQGEHANYPILISRFRVRDSVRDEKGVVSMKWFKVNAEKTSDWRKVVLEPVSDEDATTVNDDVPELSLSCQSSVSELSPSKEVKNSIREEDKKSSFRRKSGIPETFSLTDAMNRFAWDLGLKGQEEFDAFRDHHTANGSRFVDWEAAWRAWCRKAARIHAKGPTSPRLTGAYHGEPEKKYTQPKILRTDQ